jgi:phospholipase C
LADNDPIQHVVLLLLETHSFDRMPGCFNEKYADLYGVDKTRYNTAKTGSKRFFQIPTMERRTNPNPHHEVKHVKVSVGQPQRRFVIDFEASYSGRSDSQLQQVTGILPQGNGLNSLSRNERTQRCQASLISLLGIQ